MADMKRCDRCGKIEPAMAQVKAPPWVFGDHGGLEQARDLCSECFGSLEAWWKAAAKGGA